MDTKFTMISAIARKAISSFDVFKNRDFLDIVMDLDAVDEEYGLDLEAMCKAAPGFLYHDLYGISHNLNRKTKKLENGFLPRYLKNRGGK